jgi:hypothetical protein
LQTNDCRSCQPVLLQYSNRKSPNSEKQIKFKMSGTYKVEMEPPSSSLPPEYSVIALGSEEKFIPDEYVATPSEIEMRASVVRMSVAYKKGDSPADEHKLMYQVSRDVEEAGREKAGLLDKSKEFGENLMNVSDYVPNPAIAKAVVAAAQQGLAGSMGGLLKIGLVLDFIQLNNISLSALNGFNIPCKVPNRFNFLKHCSSFHSSILQEDLRLTQY